MPPEEHRREADACRKIGLHELAEQHELAATKIEQEAEAAKQDKAVQPAPFALPSGSKEPSPWSRWVANGCLSALPAQRRSVYLFDSRSRERSRSFAAWSRSASV